MAGLLKRGKVELAGDPRDLFVIDVPEVNTSDDVLALLDEANWLLTTANQLSSIPLLPSQIESRSSAITDLTWDANILLDTAKDALCSGVTRPLCRRKDDDKERARQKQALVRSAIDLLRDDGERYAYACFLLELAGYGGPENGDTDESEAA